MLQELCGSPEWGQQEHVSLKQSWHICPQKYADQQTAVMLPTGALRSCSCFNSAVCNECLLL
jgi:hypothetical protein